MVLASNDHIFQLKIGPSQWAQNQAKVAEGLDEARHLTLPHTISLSLETHGFVGWTTQWIKKWLNGCIPRIAVNGSVESSDKRLSSGISMGTDTFFSIFGGDLDSGIKWPLSKFANNARLCDAVDMLEGRDVIQRHFDSL